MKLKPMLITIAFMAVFLLTKAQKKDTTLYSGCKLSADTTQTIGSPSILDSCPQFKNGGLDLLKYLSAHIEYKNIGKHTNNEGKVIVEMVIESDGSLSHVRIAHSIAKDLDKEALRVVSSLPKWNPGVLHGQKVRVRYWTVVPFKFPAKS